MMKQEEDRLSPRQCAGTLIGICGLGGIFFEAPTPAGQALMAVAGFTTIGLGAATYFWPEIKESLQKENAPSRAATRTGRAKHYTNLNIPDSARNVNPDMEAK